MANLKRIALICVLLITIGVLAGCGNSKESPEKTTNQGPQTNTNTGNDAPKFDELLLGAIKAGEAEKDGGGDFDLNIDVKGSSDNPQAKAILENGIKANLKGYSSNDLIDLTGGVTLGKQNLDFAAKADKKQSFFQLDDVWYGPGPSLNLDSLANSGSSSLGGLNGAKTDQKTTQESLKQAEDAIKKYGNKVVDGEITEGDQIDGQDTWVYEGGLSAQGIEEVAKAENPNEKITDKDRKTLEGALKLVKMKLVFGKDDKKIYGATFTVKASEADVASIMQSSGETSSPKFSIDASVEFKINSYDKRSETTVEKPDGDVKTYQEFQQAAQSKLGALVLGSGVPLGGSGTQTPGGSSTTPQTQPDGSTTQTLPNGDSSSQSTPAVPMG